MRNIRRFGKCRPDRAILIRLNVTTKIKGQVQGANLHIAERKCTKSYRPTSALIKSFEAETPPALQDEASSLARSGMHTGPVALSERPKAVQCCGKVFVKLCERYCGDKNEYALPPQIPRIAFLWFHGIIEMTGTRSPCRPGEQCTLIYNHTCIQYKWPF